jgi:hypothetical protein
MRLHILAVGQADALILELPSGRLAVVDFGHDLLLDYLAALDPTRARRFAFCLLTHAHHDHYACLEEFIRRYDAQVEEYWFSFADTSNLPPLLALRAAAMRHGRGRLLVQDRMVAHPYVLEPQVDVTCFAPTSEEVLRAPGVGGTTAENNRSIVLLVRYGRAAALLGGDVEEERWLRIAAQAQAAGVSLIADVVKPPHHGAAPPHGLPDHLWPLLLRSSDTFVAFSVGRRPGKPTMSTIMAVRSHSHIRCTGRSVTCRPLPPGPMAPTRPPAQDLIGRALPPAPEARAVQPCFGTQVYAFDPAGTVALVQAAQPAFLDACLVPPAVPPAAPTL